MDNHMNQYDNGGGYNNGRGNGQNGNGSNGGGQPPRKPSILMLVLAGLSTVLIVFMLWNLLFGSSTGTQSVSYTDFLQYLNEDQVEAVQVQSTGVIIFTLKQQESASEENMPQNGYAFYMSQFPVQYSTVLMEDLDTLTARLEEHGVDGTRVLSDNSGRIMDILVYVVLPVV